MKRKLLWTLAVMVAGFMAMPLQAGEKQATEKQAPVFKDVDKDKNGYISADESMSVPGLADQMITLDVNKDGRLSESEFAVFEVEEEGDAAPTEEE